MFSEIQNKEFQGRKEVRFDSSELKTPQTRAYQKSAIEMDKDLQTLQSLATPSLDLGEGSACSDKENCNRFLNSEASSFYNMQSAKSCVFTPSQVKPLAHLQPKEHFKRRKNFNHEVVVTGADDEEVKVSAFSLQSGSLAEDEMSRIEDVVASTRFMDHEMLDSLTLGNEFGQKLTEVASAPDFTEKFDSRNLIALSQRVPSNPETSLNTILNKINIRGTSLLTEDAGSSVKVVLENNDRDDDHNDEFAANRGRKPDFPFFIFDKRAPAENFDQFMRD